MTVKRLASILLLCTALYMPNIKAQELKCNISVNASQIQGTNRTVFENMQKSMFEYMNNTAWTNRVFGTDERIECNIQITISEEVTTSEYKATLQVQSRRPVYNSSYNTVLLNFKDPDFVFRFNEFDQIQFNESTYTSNLASVLAYYAYIIIGLDFDTFSKEGGTEFFEKAEKIVSNAQSSNRAGWKAFEANRKNRYWLVNNVLSRGYQPLREAYYTYHRLGLDKMEKNASDARLEIISTLENIRQVYRNKPDNTLTYFKIFLDAKSNELVEIFSEAYDNEKARAVNILKEISPGGASKFDKILNSKN